MYNRSDSQLSSFNIKSFFIEWIFLIFFLLILSIFVSFMLFHQNEDILKREEDRLLTQAKILNDNLLNQINSIEQALLSTRGIIEKDGLSDKKSKDQTEYEFGE